MEAAAGKKASDAPPTAAETGRDSCDRLFRIESQLEELPAQERYWKRLELERPVLEAFWRLLDSIQFLKGSPSAKRLSMPEIKDHIWETIFWMEDVPSQTMLRRMPSAHLRLDGRAGFFLIHQRGLRQRIRI